MEICQKNKDVLRTVAMYLHTARPLVMNKTNKLKAVQLLKASDAALDGVRRDILKLDAMVSRLEDQQVQTSVVINHKNGKPSARMTLEELERRHVRLCKILEYYSHKYMTLHHETESQRLMNELLNASSKKPMVAGPHVRRALYEFLDSVGIKDSNN